MGRETNSGTAHLARAIAKRIARQNEDNTVSLDFGTILKNKALLTDSFPEAFAKTEYTCLKTGRYPANLHEGDRVLVIWVSDEPVVVGIIDE